MAKVAAQRIAGGPGPVRAAAPKRAESTREAEVVLTREQVFEAVRQLPLADKVKLKAVLESEFKEIDEGFGKALREIGRAYRHVSPEQVERDVAEAVAAVRRERATRSA